MPNFYTRTGDDGFTNLLGKDRVPKNHSIPQAVGALDEATAALGVARAASSPRAAGILLEAQRDLYNLMSEIAATPENAARFRVIGEKHVAWLETQIEAVGEQVEMPDEFIMPGDSPAGAALALARTIVRRGERHVVGLLYNGRIENEYLLPYLNRLSSLCFALELMENRLSGQTIQTLAKHS